MGNQPSTVGGLRVSRFSSADNSSNNNPKNRLIREHKRHGVVSVKINTGNSSRRLGEGQTTQIVTPKGAILYGSLFNPGPIQRAMGSANLPILVPGEVSIPDSRANKLLVTYCYGWHLIPFPEVFSRHSGTCYVVGDRSVNGPPVEIKVGDCFRLGSVGLVVSEMKINEEDEQKIDAKTLQFLKDEALAFDTNEDLAALASDEMLGEGAGIAGLNLDNSLHQSFDDDQTNRGSLDEGNAPSPTPFSPGIGLTNGEKFICYMCYETHNTTEDPLIAPCECKGDTRFLHVHCLQKWYHTSAYGSHAQVVRTTGNGAPACKICGTAYKTNFKRADGRRASILELENSGPYLSLVVVTHHDTNPGLFNTKFRLNFGRRSGTSPAITDADLNTVVIGRSSSCAMILDYRTVSTIHAKITFQSGKFYLSDNHSSNGTMIYIREPLPLHYSTPVKIRMGRTTLTLQAKRSWTAAMRSFVFGNSNTSNDEANELALAHQNGLPTPMDLMALLANIHNMPQEKSTSNNGNNNGNNEMEPNNGPGGPFLNHRSYTIRTINEGSLDGGDFDQNQNQLNLMTRFGGGGDFPFATEFLSEARQQQDFFRRFSEGNGNGNSPLPGQGGGLSPVMSHAQFFDPNGELNAHNRIFLNNNNSINASNSSNRGGPVMYPEGREKNINTVTEAYNNAADLTMDSIAVPGGGGEIGYRKTSLTGGGGSLMLTKDLTEPIFKEQDLLRVTNEEEKPSSASPLLMGSPARNNNGGQGSTIVVGGHVEGTEPLFQSIQQQQQPPGGPSSERLIGGIGGGESLLFGDRPSSRPGSNTSQIAQMPMAEITPAMTIPAAGVFAIPSSSHHNNNNNSSGGGSSSSSRKGSNSPNILNNNSNNNGNGGQITGEEKTTVEH